jgi:DNA polymerase-3 subunit alpha
MANWFPINNKTHYSICLGYSKPPQLAQEAVDNNLEACGIMDYKTLSGAVSHFSACKKVGIKPVIGVELDNFSLVAKNLQGWLSLIEIVSSIVDGQEDCELTKRLCGEGNMFVLAEKRNVVPIIDDKDFIQLKENDEAFAATYYISPEEKPLHHILLATGAKKSVEHISKTEEYATYFDESDKSAKSLFSRSIEPCERFTALSEGCGDYNILHAPMLPKYPCEGTEEEFLTELCRDGWRRKLGRTGKVKDLEKKEEYHERFKKELAVIRDADLFGYFLIVYDIVNYARSQGWLTGPGRGSAAGCLLSYLMGITTVDPVEYGLIFERFYNAGRVTDGRAELPDIDIDVPSKYRDDIIAYLKRKYGNDNVCQMVTFSNMRGRSAVKAVLKAHDACSFIEQNAATKHIPDKAEIDDQLATMVQGERSIVRWALINRPKKLRDFAYIEDGEVKGRFGEYFKQAIEMEGTYKGQGKHAAGVVISAQPLHKVCPMVDQANGGEKIAGLEMADLEALGQVKFDVLAVAVLDKIMRIDEIIEETKKDNQNG